MTSRRAEKAVAAWLALCAAMVLAMVVVGGATRLTHSGLSIVEWQPIVGTLPPLNDQQWLDTFEKYKQTPEYRLVNEGMSLGAFKGIFWWEYFHRLLGRTIGVVFLVPLLVFWWKRAITSGLARVLAGVFVLGGLQGAMGWYMVKSGLVDNPAVSPFRLTAHLLLAFAIFAALWWQALSLWRNEIGTHFREMSPDLISARRLAWAVTAVVTYMVTTGGLVAGTHAGLVYNTFPLMDGRVVPPVIMLMQPWWRNFFYNLATVQFDHRLGAWTLALLVPWVKIEIGTHFQKMSPDLISPARRAATLLVAMLAVQITLGITTLLWAVPVPLAVLHQGGAVLLFAAALNLNHALRA